MFFLRSRRSERERERERRERTEAAQSSFVLEGFTGHHGEARAPLCCKHTRPIQGMPRRTPGVVPRTNLPSSPPLFIPTNGLMDFGFFVLMSIMGPCSRGKVAALLTYILCEWFSDNFVVNFVVTTILIACDFWTVCLCLSLSHSTHKHQLGSPRH